MRKKNSDKKIEVIVDESTAELLTDIKKSFSRRRRDRQTYNQLVGLALGEAMRAYEAAGELVVYTGKEQGRWVTVSARLEVAEGRSRRFEALVNEIQIDRVLARATLAAESDNSAIGGK